MADRPFLTRPLPHWQGKRDPLALVPAHLVKLVGTEIVVVRHEDGHETIVDRCRTYAQAKAIAHKLHKSAIGAALGTL